MKKSLLVILPLATLALVGCRKNPTKSSGTSQGDVTSQSGTSATQERPSTQPTASSEAPHPASPWPAVPTGDGSEANPWNVTQAWDYVDKNLEKTYATDAAEQEKVTTKEEFYIRGYVCVIQAHSDGRDPQHPHSVQFHMADNVHHVTMDEVMNKSEHVRQGFCVYFADYKTPFASEQEAAQINRKLVTVKGHLLNWGFEPEVTKNGTIVEIGPEAPAN